MKRVEWDVLRKAEGAVLVYVYESSRKLLTGGYDVTYEYRASSLPHSASNLAPARPRPTLTSSSHFPVRLTSSTYITPTRYKVLWCLKFRVKRHYPRLERGSLPSPCLKSSRT